MCAFCDGDQKDPAPRSVERTKCNHQIVFSISTRCEKRAALIDHCSHEFPGRCDISARCDLKRDLMRKNILLSHARYTSCRHAIDHRVEPLSKLQITLDKQRVRGRIIISIALSVTPQVKLPDLVIVVYFVDARRIGRTRRSDIQCEN